MDKRELELAQQFGDLPVTTYSLYGGEILLKYNDADHEYYIDTVDGRLLVPNVTTILKIVDKSNALVPWAVKMATEHLREKVSFDIRKDEFGEIYEAALIRRTDFEKLLEDAKRAHRVAKQKAGDIGKLAHNWLERYGKLRIQGLDHHAACARLEEHVPDNNKARNCIMAALNWITEHHVVPIEAERKVYSRLYNYAGTMDWKGMVDGKRSILDFKSSKYIYDEYRLQTASYVAADEEENGRRIEQRVLLRLGKEDGAFEALVLNDDLEYENDLAAFKAALCLYEWQQELKEAEKARKEAAKQSKKAAKKVAA